MEFICTIHGCVIYVFAGASALSPIFPSRQVQVPQVASVTCDSSMSETSSTEAAMPPPPTRPSATFPLDVRRFVFPAEILPNLIERPSDLQKYKYYAFAMIDPLTVLQSSVLFGKLLEDFTERKKKVLNGFFAYSSLDKELNCGPGLSVRHFVIGVFEVAKASGRYDTICDLTNEFHNSLEDSVTGGFVVVPMHDSIKHFEKVYTNIYNLKISSGVGDSFGPNQHAKILAKLHNLDSNKDGINWQLLCDLCRNKKTESDICTFLSSIDKGHITASPQELNVVRKVFERSGQIIKYIHDIHTYNSWSRRTNCTFMKNNEGRVIAKTARYIYETLMEKFPIQAERLMGPDSHPGEAYEDFFHVDNNEIWSQLLSLLSANSLVKVVLVNSFVSPVKFYNLFCDLLIRGENKTRGINRHLLLTGPYMTGKTALAGAICELLNGSRISADNQTTATTGFMIPTINSDVNGVAIIEDISARTLQMTADPAMRSFIDGVETMARKFQKAPEKLKWPPVVTTTNVPEYDCNKSLLMPDWLHQIMRDRNLELDYKHEGGVNGFPHSLASLQVFKERYQSIHMDISLRKLGTSNKIDHLTEKDLIRLLLSYQTPDCGSFYNGRTKCRWNPCEATTCFEQHHAMCKSLLRLTNELRCELKKNTNGQYTVHRVHKDNINLFMNPGKPNELLDALCLLYDIPSDIQLRTEQQNRLEARLKSFIRNIWIPFCLFCQLLSCPLPHQPACERTANEMQVIELLTKFDLDLDENNWLVKWLGCLPETCSADIHPSLRIIYTDYELKMAEATKWGPVGFPNPIRQDVIQRLRACSPTNSEAHRTVWCLAAQDVRKRLHDSALLAVKRFCNDREIWKLSDQRLLPVELKLALHVADKNVTGGVITPQETSLFFNTFNQVLPESTVSSFAEHSGFINTYVYYA